jgi:hypothetical protein
MIKFLIVWITSGLEQTVCPWVNDLSVVKTPICYAEDNHTVAGLCGPRTKHGQVVA